MSVNLNPYSMNNDNHILQPEGNSKRINHFVLPPVSVKNNRVVSAKDRLNKVQDQFQKALSNLEELKRFFENYPLLVLHSHLSLHPREVVDKAIANNDWFDLEKIEFCSQPIEADYDPLKKFPAHSMFAQTDEMLKVKEVFYKRASMSCFKPVLRKEDFSLDSPSTSERTSHFFSMWGPLFSTKITLIDQLFSAYCRAADQNIFYSEHMAFLFPAENPPNLSVYNRESKEDFYLGLKEWIENYCNGWKEELDQIDASLTSKINKEFEKKNNDNLTDELNSIESFFSVKNRVCSRLLIAIMRTPESQWTSLENEAYFFARVAAAMELSRQDPRVVGFNVVGAESSVGLETEKEQHEILTYLENIYQRSYVLHTGEMNRHDSPENLIKESTFRALEHQHATRLGHLISLEVMKDDEIKIVSDKLNQKFMGVEVCMTGNNLMYQIPYMEHPVHTLRKNKVWFTLETDNPYPFSTNSVSELMTFIQTCPKENPCTYKEIRNISRVGAHLALINGKSIYEIDRKAVQNYRPLRINKEYRKILKKLKNEEDLFNHPRYAAFSLKEVVQLHGEVLRKIFEKGISASF